jgi:putative Mn2+ efflux pump MntP
MNPLLVLGIALALAMDCFAVSIGLSVRADGLSLRRSFRIAAHFGLFQFAMPLAGWLAGESLLRLIQGFDHWVAFGLLSFIGGRMIRESFETGDEAKPDQARTSRLIVLSLATSIDALAAGLGLGVIGGEILLPAAVIGAVSFMMTIVGAAIGPAVGRIVGKRAELVGGVVLIAVGLRILFEHLAG